MTVHTQEEREAFSPEALEIADRHGYVPAYLTTDNKTFAPVFARTTAIEADREGEVGPTLLNVCGMDGDSAFKLLVKADWFEQLKTPLEVDTIEITPSRHTPQDLA